MLKTILVASVCFTVFVTGKCSALSTVYSRRITAEETANAGDPLPVGYYKVNNIPRVRDGCRIRYECKKKLKHAEIPKPCVKFCVKSIECENGKRTLGEPNQCLELNEELVIQEYNDCRKDEDSNTKSIMPVALIDFPCQPGYMPDMHGRCREVW